MFFNQPFATHLADLCLQQVTRRTPSSPYRDISVVTARILLYVLISQKFRVRGELDNCGWTEYLCKLVEIGLATTELLTLMENKNIHEVLRMHHELTSLF